MLWCGALPVVRKWEEELETMEKVIAWMEEGKAGGLLTFGSGFVEAHEG